MDTRTGQEPPMPASLSELDALRNKIGDSFKQTAGLISHIRKPIPHGTGNGTDLDEEGEKWNLIRKIEGDLADLSHLSIRDIKTLIEIQHNKMTGEPTDDKTYLMEGLIRATSSLPPSSDNRKTLTNQFLTQLWNDMQHPPQSYLGAKFQYRSADGSNNSLIHPQLGAAGTPYARTVKPATMQPIARPNPGVVFDSVMSRKHHELHPNRISSVLFYLASIIIHDLFRTDHTDYSNSLTSSYLDLAPLYGSNQDEQDLMRTKVDGKIKPDCFSEVRLLSFPPGVGALLIMFNRFHNYAVEQLALINEGNRFPKPTPPKDPKDQGAAEIYKSKLTKFDEDLFQTGRLITCGLYVNIILIDYVRTILDLNRTDSDWQLNPRSIIKDGPPLGVGNQVSAEFNLVYRWHSAVSDRDEKWTQELWDHMFPGKDPKTVSKKEFLEKLGEEYKRTPKEPEKRPFGGLTRNSDGTLPDDGLVQILTESIEDCANSFGAQRVPAVMRAIEVLGIEQARSWNLASLNEFRQYFGLEPHRTFDSINSDPIVAEQLKHLYEHPDHVELYPGLVVEEAKKPLCPGSGLAPPFTVSRAVLSDAVSLVRGDRFYTIDYNPRTLTNWGFSEVNYDTAIDNGCMFYKLFLRAFPNNFQGNSIYAHYPLTVPSAMRQALQDLDTPKDHLYNFDKPKFTPLPIMILEYKTAKSIMADKETFKVTCGKAMEFLMGAPAQNFMLSGDGPKNAESRKMMERALYIQDWNKEVQKYYEMITTKLLKEKSCKIADFNQVDIIRDVGNLAHLHFCSELFMLPLKTDERPGVFTENELYLIMSAVFALVFFDFDVAASFPLHVKAQAATQQLGKLVQANVEEIKLGGVLSSVMQAIWPEESPLKHYGKHMIQRLLASGMDAKTLVWGHILGTAGGMVANQGQLFGQTIEYFMTEGAEQWPRIKELANEDTDESFEKLMHYFLEGSRLYGETGVCRDVAKATELQDFGRTIKVNEGDRLFVNLRAASRDPAAFPNPDSFDPTRPIDSYIHLGSGPHQCLGLPMTRISLTTMLKEVAKLEGLRPALGPQGKVHKVAKTLFPGEKYPYHAYLTEKQDSYWPFPCSLKVNWD
ncbi:heme peroxidase [Cenococcum geophilum 1.58]|uniref:heme peroxidase n=1 Tax=Cenococcum geophilum 1.58 TaxID=794803 RepID=UPI00358E08E5|nr:heme peroxidase [Cenococcum geophilum 1.58]